MADLKVSVLMATYNRAEKVDGVPLVERSIMSFLNQDYGNSELIILNDGSTDNTSEIIDAYARHPRITIYDFKDNKRPPNNWNWLWEKATGDLICQLHDDDELTVDSLSKRVALFVENPEIDVVYGGVIAQNLKKTDSTFHRGQPVDYNRIFKEEYINFTTLMYRPTLPFRFDPELRYYFDWLFKIRCLKECMVDFTPDAVMLYTVHAGQETNKCRRENMNEIEEKMMRETLKTLYS